MSRNINILFFFFILGYISKNSLNAQNKTEKSYSNIKTTLSNSNQINTLSNRKNKKLNYEQSLDQNDIKEKSSQETIIKGNTINKEVSEYKSILNTIYEKDEKENCTDSESSSEENNLEFADSYILDSYLNYIYNIYNSDLNFDCLNIIEYNPNNKEQTKRYCPLSKIDRF